MQKEEYKERGGSVELIVEYLVFRLRLHKANVMMLENGNFARNDLFDDDLDGKPGSTVTVVPV
jgi:hypothetical protein